MDSGKATAAILQMDSIQSEVLVVNPIISYPIIYIIFRILINTIPYSRIENAMKLKTNLQFVDQ